MHSSGGGSGSESHPRKGIVLCKHTSTTASSTRDWPETPSISGERHLPPPHQPPHRPPLGQAWLVPKHFPPQVHQGAPVFFLENVQTCSLEGPRF
ncbi:unnamed protein product [Ectocarpus sp. 4 AP-2014]